MRVDAIVGGRRRESLNRHSIIDYRGRQIGTVGTLSPITVRQAIGLARDEGVKALRALEIPQLIAIYDRASRLWLGELELGGERVSFEQHARLVCLATGFPIAAVLRAAHELARQWSAECVERALRAESPDGELACYDTHVASRGGVTFGWAPRGRCCAVVLPSNHPGVIRRSTLMPAMKIPTILRTSNREPFTAHRVTQALLQAGLPPSALHLVTCEQDAIPDLLREVDLGIYYGSESVVSTYADNGRVKTYGPGRSKVVVTPHAVRANAVDVTYAAMTDGAGRGCINASAILVQEGAPDPSEEVAARLGALELVDPLDPRAVVGAMQRSAADPIAAAVSARSAGARNLVSTWSTPVVDAGGASFLVPQLFRVAPGALLLQDEYPYICGAVAVVPGASIPAAAKRSLSVTIVGKDPELASQLLDEPTISKVYRGVPTSTLDLSQPHQGFLTDFLFSTKAWL